MLSKTIWRPVSGNLSSHMIGTFGGQISGTGAKAETRNMRTWSSPSATRDGGGGINLIGGGESSKSDGAPDHDYSVESLFVLRGLQTWFLDVGD
jgi:hypothetical protein